MKVEAQPSPNFNDRKHPVDMLVLHYTGMETGQGALDRMQDEAASVSAHYMIWEDGNIAQLVGEDKRAWHAGVSSWQGDEDLNSRSIGIEIVNGGHDWPQADGSLPPFPEAQIAALIELCQGILKRFDIPPSRIVGHSDIAPARKADPGEHFPWQRLAGAGIGLWPAPGASGATMPGETELKRGDKSPAVRALHEALTEIGYASPQADTFDEGTQACVTAFQRRWRPENVSGVADATTQSVLALVRSLYVD